MRRSLPFLLVLVVAGWPALAHAQTTAPSNRVDVIKVEGAIDRPLIGYLTQHLDQAVADNAVVVLESIVRRQEHGEERHAQGNRHRH